MNDAAVIAAIFGGVFLAFLSMVLAFGSGIGRRRRKRIDAVRDRVMAHVSDKGDAAYALLADEQNEQGIERFLAGLLPRRAQLRLRLQRAGLAMSPGRYAAISAASMLMALASLKVLFGLSLVLAALAGFVVGLMGPHIVLNVMIAKRTTRFLQLFPEAIDLMVRGLKSGLPISETIVSVGQEMPDPVGVEFRQIGDSVRLGATLDEALWDAANRIGLPEFRFFAISLSVQRETGGNLGETLSNLGDILRKRLTMKLKVKAMSSEARASAYIIGALPFIMFGILMMISPDYVSRLLTDPRGVIMTAVGLFMMGLGIVVMFKMVRFEI